MSAPERTPRRRCLLTALGVAVVLALGSQVCCWLGGFVSLGGARPLLVRVANGSSHEARDVRLEIRESRLVTGSLRRGMAVTMQLPRRRGEGPMLLAFRLESHRYRSVVASYVDAFTYGSVSALILDSGVIRSEQILTNAVFGYPEPWMTRSRPSE